MAVVINPNFCKMTFTKRFHAVIQLRQLGSNNIGGASQNIHCCIWGPAGIFGDDVGDFIADRDTALTEN